LKIFKAEGGFMKKGFLFFGLMVLSMTCGSLFAQGQEDEDLPDSRPGKFSLTIDFNASILSADTDGVVDSLTDIGFDEDESVISFGYESGLFGGAASLAFGQETLRIFYGEIADMLGQGPLSIDELYVWIKPFGEHFKFTGGIFENTDGIADYADDIDNFDMGVFIFGEDGAPFSEPEEITGGALANGFLTDAIFGPVTLQFLLAPNYSKESASVLGTDFFNTLAPSWGTVAADARFFRIGGKIIADIGVGTVSAMFKTFQWPMAIANNAMQLEAMATGTTFTPYTGSKMHNMTFGAYADITAVENLGLSLGYTGFMNTTNASGFDNILWNGIDLRAAWTGIPGLSISTHNNFSFAKGVEHDWLGALTGKDSYFLTIYNAVGVTKELTKKFSINAETGNVFSHTDNGSSGEIKVDNLWIGAKLIARVTEHAEFEAGFKTDVLSNTTSGAYGSDDDTKAVFSIPVGITVSF
jgi:hypothetical protein